MVKQKYKVVIVDDNQGYIEAVKAILSFRDDIIIVGEANDGFQFLELLRKQSPNIVLMDIHMPGMDGIVAAKNGLIEDNHMKLIGVTMSDDVEVHLEMLRIGFSGGILKNQFTADFDKALITISEGGVYFPLLN